VAPHLGSAAEIEAFLREKEFKLKTEEIKETWGIPRSRASLLFQLVTNYYKIVLCQSSSS